MIYPLPQRSDNMTELEKARYILLDRNNNLSKLGKELDIPVQTLRNMRSNPDMMKNTSWTRIHQLAQAYDKVY